MTSTQSKQIDVFQLSGDDHLDFIHNQIISEFDPNASSLQPTAICNPKGRVLFTLFLGQQDGHTLAAVDGTLSDNFLQYVNMRRFRLNMDIKKSNTSIRIKATKDQSSWMVAFEQNGESNLTEVDFWQGMFKMQLPWITAQSSEKHIPQHLNMDQANIISFTKGCYPGQEIVARLHYLGQVKKRMQLIAYRGESSHKNGANVELPGFEHKVTLCSPSLKTDNQWQAQAIVNQS